MLKKGLSKSLWSPGYLDRDGKGRRGKWRERKKEVRWIVGNEERSDMLCLERERERKIEREEKREEERMCQSGLVVRGVIGTEIITRVAIPAGRSAQQSFCCRVGSRQEMDANGTPQRQWWPWFRGIHDKVTGGGIEASEAAATRHRSRAVR